jgi:hypothetical protein
MTIHNLGSKTTVLELLRNDVVDHYRHWFCS